MAEFSRIYITGAPGSGVTTLGGALAARIGATHIDTDDHYWMPTEPAFQVKREPEDRVRRVKAEQARTGRWMLSGGCETWRPNLLADMQLVLFLEVPTPIRLARLEQRQGDRFGDAILPGGAMHETHREFVEWTAHYEDGTEHGRSRPRHERWLATLEVPVMRLDGTRPVADLVDALLART